jgi:acetyl esterase
MKKMKVLTQEQYRKKGKRFHKLERFFTGPMYALMKKRNAALRKEMFIETTHGKIRTVWYGLHNPAPSPLLIDLHGGGFILGSPEMDERMNILWSRDPGLRIVSIDYPKAPGHPFPQAVEGIYAVIEHLFDHAVEYGIDAQKVAIGGHSAGANLATVSCIKANKSEKINFVCQFLNCPPLDLATTALEKPHPKGSIPRKMSFIFDNCYLNGADGHHPYISPVYAHAEDLKGLPPAMIIVAGRDSLHDEGVLYYKKLIECGVDARLLDYPDGLHCFILKRSVRSEDAFEKASDFLRQHLQG